MDRLLICQEVPRVEEPILKITPKKYTGESAVISMRLPKDMLRDLDIAAEASGRTRNELLTLCMEFSLNHMEIIANKEEN